MAGEVGPIRRNVFYGIGHDLYAVFLCLLEEAGIEWHARGAVLARRRRADKQRRVRAVEPEFRRIIDDFAGLVRLLLFEFESLLIVFVLRPTLLDNQTDEEHNTYRGEQIRNLRRGHSQRSLRKNLRRIAERETESLASVGECKQCHKNVGFPRRQIQQLDDPVPGAASEDFLSTAT